MNMNRQHNQRGFTLLEMVIGLAVMGILFAGVWQLVGGMNQQFQDQAVASQTRLIVQAAQKYARINGSTLQTVLPAGSPGAWRQIQFNETIPADGIPPLVPDFLSSGLVDATNNVTNSLGQTYTVLARRNGTQVETFVVARGAPDGAISDVRASRLAGMIGADGGTIPADDTSNVYGSYGSWKMAVSEFNTYFTGGNNLKRGDIVAATYYGQTQMLADYLYRNNIGQPAANQMNTNIDMNGHDINNLNEIRPATVSGVTSLLLKGNLYADDVVNANYMTARNGMIITAGNLDVVNDILARSAYYCSDGNNCWNTRRLTLDGPNGAIWMEGNFHVRGTSYFCSSFNNCAGTANILMESSNGNITSKGTVNAYGVVTTSDIHAAGNLSSNGNLWILGTSRFDNNITVRTGHIHVQNGSISLSGGVSAGGAISGTGMLMNGFSLFDYVGYNTLEKRSDINLKKDIHPIENALERLLQIQGVEYKLKADGQETMGVIAQDVEKVFPTLVHQNAEGIKSVEYDALIGPVIEAIREIKKENEELRAKIKEIERQ